MFQKYRIDYIINASVEYFLENSRPIENEENVSLTMRKMYQFSFLIESLGEIGTIRRKTSRRPVFAGPRTWKVEL